MSGAHAGVRVVLVAAFNRRYHRSGLALAAALQSLGCEVRRCEERMRGLNAVLRRSLPTRLAALLRQPTDLVLVFKGAALAPAAVAELRRGTPTSTRLAPAYDWFFTHDTSSLDHHRRAGVRASYLAFGCDPAYVRPLPEVRPRWRAPLVFVGSRDPVREHVLRQLADLGLATWGPGWPGGPVYGDDYVRALAGGTVGLNIHQQFGERGAPERYGTGANMRVFELAAVGTPQLSDAKADIARHFTPGREIVLYRGVPELRDRVRALLADQDLRRSLAVAARQRALREHTWAHRLDELLSVALR